MDPYFPIILTQNALLCLGTAYLVYRSTILRKNEKICFYLCLAVGLLITLCELVSTGVEGTARFIWLQHLANFLNIGLTPLLPALPVLVIGRSRWSKAVVLVPVILNLSLLVSGLLYTVDGAGNYSRDPFFWLFMFFYLFNMVFLTYRSFAFSYLHQNHNVVSLLFICSFMISSTTIQLRHPQIHFSWFCVTVTILLYFIYYADTMHKKDILTGLLNRNAFQDDSVRSRKSISGVLMIDMDEFKSVNDTYGHLEGDRFLIAFAQCLRSAFGRTGYCYRLGGDEFCVLRDRVTGVHTPESLCRDLEQRCEAFQGLPEKMKFSWGYQHLEKDMTVEEAVELADKSMYAAKAERKKRYS